MYCVYENLAHPNLQSLRLYDILTIVLSIILDRGVDTLQKVRGLKSAVRAYNAWKHFCDHAHIGDKGSLPLDDSSQFYGLD